MAVYPRLFYGALGINLRHFSRCVFTSYLSDIGTYSKSYHTAVFVVQSRKNVVRIWADIGWKEKEESQKIVACRVEPLAAKLLKKTWSGFERGFLFLSENGLFSFLLFDFVGFVSNRFFSRLCRKVFLKQNWLFLEYLFFPRPPQQSWLCWCLPLWSAWQLLRLTFDRLKFNCTIQMTFLVHGGLQKLLNDYIWQQFLVQ